MVTFHDILSESGRPRDPTAWFLAEKKKGLVSILNCTFLFQSICKHLNVGQLNIISHITHQLYVTATLLNLINRSKNFVPFSLWFINKAS